MKLKDWLNRKRDDPWPIWNTAYLQSEVIGARSGGLEDPGGICFRLAYKWLVAQRTGREFQYLRHRLNIGAKKVANKAIPKQLAYLNIVAPHERAQNAPRGATDNVEYARFHVNVDRESTNLLNLWGAKHGMVFQSTGYNSFVGCGALKNDISAIVGLYGRSEVGPWGHATAFHRRGSKVLYFDSNGGEFTIDADEAAGDLIQRDIQRYAEPGDADGYTLEDLHLYAVR